MSEVNRLHFWTLSRDGLHRINWFAHAWSTDLASRPEGVLLALEPRLERGPFERAELTAAQAQAARLWNMGFPPDLERPVSLRAVRTVIDAHHLEAFTAAPGTLRIDCFIPRPDGNWTHFDGQTGTRFLPFTISRGLFGVRIAISVKTEESHQPKVHYLAELHEHGGKPTFRDVPITPVLSTMLRKIAGINAPVNVDILAPEKWDSGTAATLARVAINRQSNGDAAAQLTGGYWRTVGSILDLGDSLLSQELRDRSSSGVPRAPITEDFSPWLALQRIATQAASDLCWATEPSVTFHELDWNAVADRAIRFCHAFESGKIAALPEPLPERGGDRAWLQDALRRATAAGYLTLFHCEQGVANQASKIAEVASRLRRDSDDLAGFLHEARVERILKSECTALLRKLQFEGISDVGDPNNLSAFGSIQEQIDLLKRYLAPIAELNRGILLLGESIGLGERAVDAAQRVLATRTPYIAEDVRRAETRAVRLLAMGTTSAASPPRQAVSLDFGAAAMRERQPTVAQLHQALAQLQGALEHVKVVDLWSERQREALVYQASTTVEASMDSPEKGRQLLALVSAAIDSFDSSLFRKLLSVAPRYGRVLTQVSHELFRLRDIRRIVAAAVPEEPNEAPEVTALVGQIRTLLTALDITLDAETDWAEFDVILGQVEDLFASRLWFRSADRYCGGDKFRLASAWRRRVDRARRELSRVDIGFHDAILDVMWMGAADSSEKFEPRVRNMLRRHGCLPDPALVEAMEKAWPN